LRYKSGFGLGPGCASTTNEQLSSKIESAINSQNRANPIESSRQQCEASFNSGLTPAHFGRLGGSGGMKSLGRFLFFEPFCDAVNGLINK
jgi:hypothetical protein